MASTLKTEVVQNPSSATTNITLDASGGVALGQNLSVTGTTSLTGAATLTGNATAAAFVPSGSTVPTNGVYLSAANTVGIATNSTAALTISSSQNTTSAGTVVMSSPYTMRNKIINGAMVIDQRNAGASVSVSTTGVFPVDRIVCNASGGGVYSAQRSSVAPTGFSNSLLMTVTTNRTSVGASEFYGFQQNIEGFNVADLAFGTSGAQTVTVSFWVRSSLTGITSLRLTNNTLNRTYVTTYTISSANTWEFKTITIPGDTSGTWTTDNTKGLEIFFNLTSGSNFLTSSINQWITTNTHGFTGQTLNVLSTNGATFQITGLQIERGTVATPFEYRNYQQELAMCQRYYYAWNWSTGNDAIGQGYSFNTTQSSVSVILPVTPRTTPSLSSSGIANMVFRDGTNTARTVSSIGINVLSSGQTQTLAFTISTASLTAGQGCFVFATGASQIGFNAEL